MHNNIDNDFYAQGYTLIAGADEAGRGAWAGPLVAAAVIMPRQQIIGMNDSKKLTPLKRRSLFDEIMQQAVCWAIVSINQTEIDQHGVHKANIFALGEAITGLRIVPDIALIDGFALQHTIKTERIIHGDALSYSIAAASILAKVTRDRLMCLADKYDDRYAFTQHKGYGTQLHQDRLQQHGVASWHRQSFAPIQQLVYNSK